MGKPRPAFAIEAADERFDATGEPVDATWQGQGVGPGERVPRYPPSLPAGGGGADKALSLYPPSMLPPALEETLENLETTNLADLGYEGPGMVAGDGYASRGDTAMAHFPHHDQEVSKTRCLLDELLEKRLEVPISP